MPKGQLEYVERFGGSMLWWLDDRLTDQEPRLIDEGIWKEKFRAAAAVKSDEMEGVDVNGDVPDGWWAKMCGIDNLGLGLVVNFLFSTCPGISCAGSTPLLSASQSSLPSSGIGVIQTVGIVGVRLCERPLIDPDVRSFVPPPKVVRWGWRRSMEG